MLQNRTRIGDWVSDQRMSDTQWHHSSFAHAHAIMNFPQSETVKCRQQKCSRDETTTGSDHAEATWLVTFLLTAASAWSKTPLDPLQSSLEHFYWPCSTRTFDFGMFIRVCMMNCDAILFDLSWFQTTEHRVRFCWLAPPLSYPYESFWSLLLLCVYRLH